MNDNTWEIKNLTGKIERVEARTEQVIKEVRDLSGRVASMEGILEILKNWGILDVLREYHYRVHNSRSAVAAPAAAKPSPAKPVNPELIESLRKELIGRLDGIDGQLSELRSEPGAKDAQVQT